MTVPATTSPMLALPSAERARPKNLVTIGALLGGIGALMAVGALAAAWFSIGHVTKPWPPEGADISNYDGTMLALTMLMSAVTVEWGIYSARRSLRSQAVTAFGVSIGLGVAFLVLLWFFGSRLGFGPGESPFAVLLFAMLAVIGVAVAVGVAVLMAVAARVLGQQLMGANVEAARAAGWFWQSIVVASVVFYATVWLFS